MTANAASFDCTKAAQTVEKLICSDHSLSALDDQLSQVFAHASEQSANPLALKEEQRDWIRNSRNLTYAEAIKKAYDQRIKELIDLNPKEQREFLSCRYKERGNYGDMVDIAMLVTPNKARVRWETGQYASGYFGCFLDTDESEWKMDSQRGKYRFTNVKDPACTFVVKVTKEKAYFLSPIVNSQLAKSINACGCGQNGAYWDVSLNRSSGKCETFER